MNAQTSVGLLVQLIRDTVRQALASGICWMMLAVTAVCVVLCLSVSVSGDRSLRAGAGDEPALFLPAAPRLTSTPEAGDGPTSVLDSADPAVARREGVETVSGRVTLAFGEVAFPLSRERRDAVHFLELILAGGIAGTVGLLMALVWTAGFAPTFLEPGAASVLLAKPVTRLQLLLGKYFGVLAFVACQVMLFVGLTWLALGARTGFWDLSYWWCIPLLLLQFAVFYSFSILLAVVTRNTVACVFGAVLFWLLAWGVNYATVMVHTGADSHEAPPVTQALAEAAYWIAPKPIDGGLMMFNALDSAVHFEKPAAFHQLERWPDYSPSASIVSSLLLTVVILCVAAHEFRIADY